MSNTQKSILQENHLPQDIERRLNRTRNFCIIAHIDHGKTTLSDRLLEETKTVDKLKMQDQLLDSMSLERERGITIKCHPVSMLYSQDPSNNSGNTRPENLSTEGSGIYFLNLIDTPGHVDFAYEVSRSLAACEGALLLIDAAQGVEAQTVANAYLAINQGLIIIPVINKIDLPSAQPDIIKKQVEDLLAIPGDECILASAKAGIGIIDILNAVVERVPKPKFADYPGTRALIFDSVFDSYQGVICYVRVFSGSLKAGDEIIMMSKGKKVLIKEVGQFKPKMVAEPKLDPGSVGYVVTNVKEVSEIKSGDTITHALNPAKEMLLGYEEVRPMVFSGIYPIDTSDYEKLKASIGKLKLNDSALVYQTESSIALGFGFRCGFLGLLHMEIVQERLRREYDLDIISSYPSVVYKVTKTDGSLILVDNPAFMPDPTLIKKIEEPTIRATLHVPLEFVGDILKLVSEKRGYCDHTETIDDKRIMLSCCMPLNEILVDFNDSLKSLTRGYGSMDYELSDYVESDLVKMNILVNGDPIDAFSSIVHRDKAEGRGRSICEKLVKILPQQLFKVAIQASIGNKIIAREDLRALRKDVTAKCYGGDITRKKKLLEKQKKGKERMKQVGKVSIPQDAFIRILKNE